MAEITAEAAKITTSSKDKTTTTRAQPFAPIGQPRGVRADGASISFDRNAFEGGMAGLPVLSDRGRTTEGGVVNKEITISEEVFTGLRESARSYTQKLIDQQDPDHLIDYGGRQMTVYEAMKQSQISGAEQLTYMEDEAMLEVFTKLSKDGKSREILSSGEVTNLLMEHPLLLQNIMLVQERLARDTLAARGLRAQMHRPGNRVDPNSLARSYDFPTDQGELRRLIHRVADWENRPAEQAGRAGDETNLQQFGRRVAGVVSSAGGVGVAGFVAGGPVGAVAGAIAGGASAIGLGRGLREGARLDIVRDADVLTQSQRPEEVIRMRYLIGVDPIQVEDSTRLEQAMEEARQIIMLRAMYLKDLGVKPENMDALSDQFISTENGRFESIDTKMNKVINERFNEERDAYIVAHPLPPGGHLSADIRRDIFRRVQEEVSMSRFRRVIEERKAQENLGPRLKQAIDARREGGTTIADRTREATEEKGRLEADKQVLDGSTRILTEYEKKMRAITEAQQALQRELAGINGGALDYDHALIELSRALNTAGATINIATPTGVTMITDLYTDILTHQRDIAAEFRGIPPKDPDQDIQQHRDFVREEQTAIRLAHKPETDEDDRRKTLITNAIAKLNTLHEQTEAASKDLLKTQEVINGGQEFSKIQDAAFRLFTLGFDETYLSTTDFNQILDDANAGFDVDNSIGWPERDNEQMRESIRRAIIQSRANVAERGNRPLNNPTYQANFDSFRGIGLTTEQIALLSVDELRTRYQRVYPGPGAANRAQQAQRWAVGQLGYLQDSIRQENVSIQAAEAIQERRIRSIDLDLEREQLEMISGMYERKGEIDSLAYQALLSTRETYEDVAVVVRGTDGYTQAEADSALPRNVLEILNILTNYQQDADRNAAFARIWKRLGSSGDTILLPRLRQAFEMPAPLAPAVDNIVAFATELQTGVNARQINSPDFGRALGVNAVRQFAQWGLSL